MNRVTSGFFVFKMVKSYGLCMGVANVHFKKNRGLAFHRTGDRPEAPLFPVVMNSQRKTSEYVGLFFPGRLTNTLKFSAEFNTIIQKQRKPASER